MQNRESKKLTILHVISVDNPEGNGVYAAVKNYIKYENKMAKVGLLDIKGKILDINNTFNYKDHRSISSLEGPFKQPDIVIFNEVYVKEYIQLYKECLKRKIPYIIIPHGCLTRSAQKRKYIKKAVANVLVFNNFINNAKAIQFLNEYEQKNSKKVRVKSIIHGNGIENVKDNHVFPEKINVTYIGRYSINHKGLDILFNSIKENIEYIKDKNINVNIYGRDSVNTIDEINNLAKSIGISDIVKINSPIYGVKKDEVLKNTTIFVQTSRYEGQPMGIIEALSYGIPCLVTYETSFGKIVNNHHCGIGTKLCVSEIAHAFRNLIEKKDINMMSRNAIKLIRDNYTWESVLRSTVAEYEGIIGDKHVH